MTPTRRENVESVSNWQRNDRFWAYMDRFKNDPSGAFDYLVSQRGKGKRGMEKQKKVSEGEVAAVKRAEEGLNNMIRVRLGIELEMRGQLYSLLGRMLSETNEPRAVCEVIKHVKHMLKHDRPLNFHEEIDMNVEEVWQWAIKKIEADYDSAERCG